MLGVLSLPSWCVFQVHDTSFLLCCGSESLGPGSFPEVLIWDSGLVPLSLSLSGTYLGMKDPCSLYILSSFGPSRPDPQALVSPSFPRSRLDP